MTIVQIILIAAGGILALLVLLVVGYVVRMRAQLRRPIPVEVSGTARQTPDLPISTREGAPLMDVYGPAQPGEARPLLLFVPGDGPEWLLRGARKWGMFKTYGQLAVDRGCVAAIADHRSSRTYKDAAGMVSDVEEALATLRDRSGELGIDPDRVVVWTFSGSSGPVLTGMLERPVPGVRALLSFYGFLDLGAYPMKLPAGVADTWSLPPALGRLEALPCPVYVMNVGKDRKMMKVGYDRVAAAVAGSDLPVTLRLYQAGKHGFEVLSPADEVRAEIDRAFQFIEASLGSVA